MAAICGRLHLGVSVPSTVSAASWAAMALDFFRNSSRCSWLRLRLASAARMSEPLPLNRNALNRLANRVTDMEPERQAHVLVANLWENLRRVLPSLDTTETWS